MSETMEFVVRAILIGAGATLVMDLWAIFLKQVFGVPSLDYRLVGRWIGHFPQGHFAHDEIRKAAPVRGEGAIGWLAHYAIGIVFAALLLVVWGVEWGRQPTLVPALVVGLLTLAAPFLIMQPGMGAGIAASKMPKPNVARLRSFMAHTAFGVGLYTAAVLSACLLPV